MFIVILVTLVVFIILILLLTSLIIGAEMKLVNHSDVTITINGKDDEALTVESGKTLLDTLSEKNILLPSACGGQGTCGVCECKVIEGGGDLLPTETTHISRKEARDGMRLACQVQVKEDMKIEVPDEIFSIKKWECEVISNKGVATYIKEFVVRLPEGETLDFKSGGYIQIEAPAHIVDFSRDIEK
ncbi:MAG: 2Fe-2S iron-sulfur cluster-binding protein [Bacteroidales bacterium]|jgi:Na+-transporting NADH:ubiquinone oxidoreductase subunit F|nr:2Fe-2S iron-sulfur cluster-binding protein [Bacteroidales bacterium]